MVITAPVMLGGDVVAFNAFLEQTKNTSILLYRVRQTNRQRPQIVVTDVVLDAFSNFWDQNKTRYASGLHLERESCLSEFRLLYVLCSNCFVFYSIVSVTRQRPFVSGQTNMLLVVVVLRLTFFKTFPANESVLERLYLERERCLSDHRCWPIDPGTSASPRPTNRRDTSWEHAARRKFDERSSP